LGIAGGAIVAVIAFLILDQVFKATMPDCSPGQIDGQCGLATFLQEIYSLAGALAAWLLSSFLLSSFLLRRANRTEENSETLN
jgi:hypothetical protein